MIDHADMDLFILTDEVEEAVEHIVSVHTRIAEADVHD